MCLLLFSKQLVAMQEFSDGTGPSAPLQSQTSPYHVESRKSRFSAQTIAFISPQVSVSSLRDNLFVLTAEALTVDLCVKEQLLVSSADKLDVFSQFMHIKISKAFHDSPHVNRGIAK